MRCPYCGYKESKVVDSRPAEEGSSIRRRRECLQCEKRTVSLSQITAAADKIEQTLTSALKTEVSSSEIGELVMNELKKIDDVSYVRFASVYRQFKDLNTFMEELQRLLNEEK